MKELTFRIHQTLSVPSQPACHTPQTTPTHSQTSSQPEAQAEDKPALHILLVEDNEVNQRVALAMLKKWGHRVDIAWNGREAVEAVRRQGYDLVLMDIQMPVMDGITATQTIRQLEGENASVPIVAITANAMQGDRERFLAAGMDGYLAKPIDRNAFYAIVHHYTAQDRPAQTVIPEAHHECQSGSPLLGHEVLSYLLNELSGEIVVELIDEYMTHSASLLSQALVASEARDEKSVEYAVHTLKGMSGALGALRLVEICQHILETCHDQGMNGLGPHLHGLLGTTEETQQALQAWRSKHEAC